MELHWGATSESDALWERHPKRHEAFNGSMPDYVAAMKTGVRVLKAISDRVNPAFDDVEELRRLAPEFSDLSLDDLAFEIILRASSRGQIPKCCEDITGGAMRPSGSWREGAAFHGGVTPCGPIAHSGT
jgi:hypothetical protein